MLENWRRHDLVRVRPQVWAKVLEAASGFAALPHVGSWAEQGWPLIVRRYTPEDDLGLVPVALPLPPVCGKQRVAVQVAEADICEKLPPRTLRSCREAVPPIWRDPVDTLLEMADQLRVEPRVFGSLLWQRLTGLPYLSDTSDLDLLWPITGRSQATILVERLTAFEAQATIRLDGEIFLPNGSGFHWREWRRGAAEVLVKTSHAVTLRTPEDLFAELAPAR